jgi:tetratricopeptide (TPR) repeat protein
MADLPEPDVAPEAPMFDTSATALGLALEGSRSNGGDAAAFLDAQRGLIELQKDHLKEQFKQLKLHTAGDVVKLALQCLSLAAVVVLMAVLGVMARDAMNANGLVVAGFSAPPSFTARGLTGEVLGNDLTGRVAALARYMNANSFGRSDDVRADRADAVKLEIPETGISLAEVDRYLRSWLGHERRLTADLRDEGAGMASITLALAGSDPVVVRGAAADMDGLMKAAAEKAFALFDPNNAIVFLGEKGRLDEALALAEQYVHASPTPREHAVAYSLWSLVDPDRVRALGKAQVAIRTDPSIINGWFEGMNASVSLGHDEAALAYATRVQKTRREAQVRTLQAAHASMIATARHQAGLVVGDYTERWLAETWSPNDSVRFAMIAQVRALRHDPAGALEQIGLAQNTGGLPPNYALETRWASAAGAGDWPAARAAAESLVQLAGQDLPGSIPQFSLKRVHLPLRFRPWLALADAETGDVAGAQALAAMGPLDCYLCVRVRGQVAEAAGDRAGADHWFAEAVRQGPLLPFAHLEWGQAKLARGDKAGAIAEFSRAHALSPRFADATEAWGEALASGGDAASATDKYAEAARSAPNWGRLHLKWGEALAKQSRAGEAHRQFRIAAALYLSGPDRAELAGQRI